MAKPCLLGVGLLFGGWVGAKAWSRGPARFTFRAWYKLQLVYRLHEHPIMMERGETLDKRVGDVYWESARLAGERASGDGWHLTCHYPCAEDTGMEP
jgi:hypothetical protein